MLEIGITGGIGSGKSTVARIFELLGIPVYYADTRAKEIMVENKEVVKKIKSVFGPEAYTEKAELNRQHLANIAFRDSSKLSQLNAIVHPAVWQDGKEWNLLQTEKGVPYTLKEAALIFESGGNQFLDKVICVYTPIAVRIQRVIKRDQTDQSAVEARIEKQLPDEIKMEKSDFIIYNDGSRLISEQVLKIHKELLEIQAGKS